jgi:hypothetical protein
MSTAIDSLHLGAEIEGASPIQSLANTPLITTILSAVGLEFRDRGLDAKAGEEFRRLQDSIADAVQNEAIGFLLQVSVLVDTEGAGAVVIPGGQLLLPIGVGIEPLDALTQYMATTPYRVDGSRPGFYQDNTFYYWIGKRNGQLMGRPILREYCPHLQKAALDEWDRRKLLGAWERAWPNEKFRTLQRAEYWAEVERDRAAALRSESHRREVAELGNKMREQQAEFNKLYRNYQELERQISRQQEYLATLDKIATIASIIDNGIKAGQIFCSGTDVPAAGGEIGGSTKAHDLIEITERRIQEDGTTRTIIERHLRIRSEDIRGTDKSLGNAYGNDAVEIPPRDMDLPPFG